MMGLRVKQKYVMPIDHIDDVPQTSRSGNQEFKVSVGKTNFIISSLEINQK